MRDKHWDDLPTVAEVRTLPKDVTVLFRLDSSNVGHPCGAYSDISLAIKASEAFQCGWFTRTFTLDAPPVGPREVLRS